MTPLFGFSITLIFIVIWTIRNLPFINLDMAYRFQVMMMGFLRKIQDLERDLERTIKDDEEDKE